MERLLRYSLERQEAIRMIYLEEGKMKQSKVYVENMDENTVTVLVVRPQHRITLPRSDIFGVDFRKDDPNLK